MNSAEIAERALRDISAIERRPYDFPADWSEQVKACPKCQLHDNFGDQSWPFGKEPRTGRWFRGGATIHGWTWFGFATEADMQAFLAAWPNPEGDGSKQDREA